VITFFFEYILCVLSGYSCIKSSDQTALLGIAWGGPIRAVVRLGCAAGFRGPLRGSVWRVSLESRQARSLCVRAGLWCVLRLIWRRPIFPGSCPPSIFGAGELNFRVRNGNGWNPSAKATRNLYRPRPETIRPFLAFANRCLSMGPDNGLSKLLSVLGQLHSGPALWGRGGGYNRNLTFSFELACLPCFLGSCGGCLALPGILRKLAIKPSTD
jgi:hypothetical protein